MKHILLAAALAAPLMMSAATVNANNNYVTRTLPVAGTFSELDISQVDVEYIVASAVSVELTAPSNVADILTVRVHDNSLEVFLPQNTNVRYERGRARAKLKITGPVLREIEASLSATFTAKTPFTGDKLDVEANTSARINLGAVTMSREFDAEANTSATITVTGALASPKGDLEANTGAKIKADAVNGGTWQAECNTGATIHLAGTAVTLQADANTGATIDASALTVNMAYGDSATGATVKVKAVNMGAVETSTGGSFRNIP